MPGLSNCGVFADELPKNKEFANYLVQLAEKNKNVKAGRGEISFDFYDFDLLVDVFNYAKERQTGEYSLAIKINFFNDTDFEKFRKEILDDENVPKEMKAFLNSVILENLMDDFARFSFGEKQFMIIDMELKNNQRCICVEIDEKHW